ncbi:hypothetical protein HMPREF1531_00815 [Propionibacterium sp. oral taxon 192 str. F0372]|uniref:zinc-dependent alcohol dehydrogenase n=1 Tax=Propionibacterium sp. oral taxon 192 TaxID=671222 RepID=UPI0003548DDD|nr:medium chain dehydrogenase/reductase family protein [Propionibacterium sp. oral taxon 192]EPH06166.1 hypothetical protein HMPREF1531_00815 [Propionibacterium sp. oral taxon 192 str. F0372]
MNRLATTRPKWTPSEALLPREPGSIPSEISRGSDIRLEILKPGIVVLREDPSAKTAPGQESVRVAVEFVSLCGSDHKLFEGTYQGPHHYPITFGHEWSGRVIHAPAQSPFREGDLVTGDCSRYCGECRQCSVDPNTCRSVEKFGITVDGFSRSIVDISERYLYPVPDALPSALAAICEPTAVAYRAVAPHANLAAAHGALVVGAGHIGLAAVLVLQSFGVRDITVADTVPERLALSREILAGIRTESGIEIQPGDTYFSLKRCAQFGFIFDATGSSEGLAQALVRADFHGTVVTVGMLRQPKVPLDLVTTKALRLFGSIGGTGAFHEVMEIMLDHDAEFRRFIGRQVVPEEWQTVFVTRSTKVKDQIRFGGSCG